MVRAFEVRRYSRSAVFFYSGSSKNCVSIWTEDRVPQYTAFILIKFYSAILEPSFKMKLLCYRKCKHDFKLALESLTPIPRHRYWRDPLTTSSGEWISLRNLQTRTVFPLRYLNRRMKDGTSIFGMVHT